MTDLLKEFEELKNISKDLDGQLNKFLESINIIILSGKLNELTDFSFIKKLLLLTGQIQAISIDLTNTFLDVSVIANKQEGTEFTKKIVDEIRKLHAQNTGSLCNCSTCNYLDKYLQEIQAQETKTPAIDKSKLN